MAQHAGAPACRRGGRCAHCSFDIRVAPSGHRSHLRVPVAKLLMGKAVGDVVGESGQELEIVAIS